MGTAIRPAKTSPGPWDASADIDVFVDEVLAELEAMAREGARPIRPGPRLPLAGAALRKAIMATNATRLPAIGTRPIVSKQFTEIDHIRTSNAAEVARVADFLAYMSGRGRALSAVVVVSYSDSSDSGR